MVTTYFASPVTVTAVAMDTVGAASAAYDWQASAGIGLQVGDGATVIGWITSTALAGGTSLAFKIETSHDAATWVDMVTGIALTAAAPTISKKATTAAAGIISKPLKYLRLKTTGAVGVFTAGEIQWGIA